MSFTVCDEDIVLQIYEDKSKDVEVEEKLRGRYLFVGKICTFAPKITEDERKVERPFGYVYGEFLVGNHVAYF